MNTVKIEFDLPEDILLTLNKNITEISEDIKKLMALELYATGKLSLGKSSKLLNICKTDFIKLLSEKGFSVFNWGEEETNLEFESSNLLNKEL